MCWDLIFILVIPVMIISAFLSSSFFLAGIISYLSYTIIFSLAIMWCLISVANAAAKDNHSHSQQINTTQNMIKNLAPYKLQGIYLLILLLILYTPLYYKHLQHNAALFVLLGSVLYCYICIQTLRQPQQIISTNSI
jgi:small-conductance mechanosensitive channel